MAVHRIHVMKQKAGYTRSNVQILTYISTNRHQTPTADFICKQRCAEGPSCTLHYYQSTKKLGVQPPSIVIGALLHNVITKVLLCTATWLTEVDSWFPAIVLHNFRALEILSFKVCLEELMNFAKQILKLE